MIWQLLNVQTKKSIHVSGIYVYGEKEVNMTKWDQLMNPGEQYKHVRCIIVATFLQI